MDTDEIPIDATLTTGEKNLLFRLILEQKFDPADFVWSELKTQEYNQRGLWEYTSSRLTHRKTGYYFIIGGQKLIFSPGTLKKVETVFHEDDWGKKGTLFKEWVKDLREEVDQPDLWVFWFSVKWRGGVLR